MAKFDSHQFANIILLPETDTRLRISSKLTFLTSVYVISMTGKNSLIVRNEMCEFDYIYSPGNAHMLAAIVALLWDLTYNTIHRSTPGDQNMYIH